jgi:hypothetical protein
MAKNTAKKMLLALPGLAALLLSGCGQAITRSKAQEFLSAIVAEVEESDFASPKEWSLERTSKGTLEADGRQFNGSLNETFNFSLTDSYFHSTLAVNGKMGSPISLAYTSEEWCYTDVQPVAGGAKTYSVIHAVQDGSVDPQKKVYTLDTYKSSEEAIAAFQAFDSVKKELERTQDLETVPSSLKETLAGLSPSEVRSETYSTIGESSFESSLTYQRDGLEYHDETVIKEALLQSVVQSKSALSSSSYPWEEDPALSLHVTYAWGRYKNSKPDLPTFERN